MARPAAVPWSSTPSLVTPPKRTAAHIPTSANAAPAATRSKIVAIARSPILASAAPAISGAALVCVADGTVAGGVACATGKAAAHLLQVKDPAALSFPQEGQNMGTSMERIGKPQGGPNN